MDIEKEKLIATALDYVRCGIGANCSRESFSDRMREIYTPFSLLIEQFRTAEQERDQHKADLDGERERAQEQNIEVFGLQAELESLRAQLSAANAKLDERNESVRLLFSDLANIRSSVPPMTYESVGANSDENTMHQGYCNGWNDCRESMLSAYTIPAQPSTNTGHDWNDQDKCKKCGDRDWYAGSECAGDNKPSPVAADAAVTEIAKLIAAKYKEHVEKRADARKRGDLAGDRSAIYSEGCMKLALHLFEATQHLHGFGSPDVALATPQQQSSPRITEQDAREIFKSIELSLISGQAHATDQWLDNSGRALLNKLNAKPDSGEKQ